MTPTIRYVQKLASKALLPIVENPAKEANLLLMHYLECDEMYLLTNQDKEIKIDGFLQLLKRRLENEPLEYITKKVSFYSEEFFIDYGALIPRPETELLIDEVLKRVDKDTTETFCEVGIGSGVISVILAKKLKNAKFIATDISGDAITIAKKNIKLHNLEDRIKIIKTSLLDGVDEKIDYLVSNPPYIKKGFKLDSNLSYEPDLALFGGNEGDEIVKQLINITLERKINFFSCEIGYDQKDKITKFVKDKNIKIEFYKDYSGFDRGFTLFL